MQGLYDALLSTMKNGRTLGQSGRFTHLEPVIRRTFDIPSMTRLSVGLSWAGLTEAQRQELERRADDDDANPADTVPWEQVKAEALARFQKK